MTGVTFPNDAAPGQPYDDDKHIAAVWEAPENVMRSWFSGELPEAGAKYAMCADWVYETEDGRKGVALRFVRI